MTSFRIWNESLNEFRKPKVLAVCGLMCALAVVLGYTSTIQIGPYIKVGFSGIPNQVVDYLFGPAVGAVFGGTLDVLKYLIQPDGAFFPGFTVSAVLGGVIYGYAFYRKKVSLPRVFIAQLFVKLFVNCFLNTLWLNMLYGKAIAVLLPSRIVSNAIMLPVDTAICYLVLKAVERYTHGGKTL